jgi:hypothetical protein
MKNNIDIQTILVHIKKTANLLIERVFELNHELKGKEETITGNLQSELSNHFVTELENDLKGVKYGVPQY